MEFCPTDCFATTKTKPYTVGYRVKVADSNLLERSDKSPFTERGFGG